MDGVTKRGAVRFAQKIFNETSGEISKISEIRAGMPHLTQKQLTRSQHMRDALNYKKKLIVNTDLVVGGREK